LADPYTALLTAAYKAVHHADRRARVVTNALVGLVGPGLVPAGLAYDAELMTMRNFPSLSLGW
jgi:hypothetical protein